jgi:hypothetical protein
MSIPYLAIASDKVYQLLVHGRWFSPGTPASSTTKTGRHDIVEILLKVALKLQKSINLYKYVYIYILLTGIFSVSSSVMDFQFYGFNYIAVFSFHDFFHLTFYCDDNAFHFVKFSML